jgi:hypothetical protein
MAGQQHPESIGQVFHKESNKENLNTKGLMPLGQRPEANELKEGSKGRRQMQIAYGQTDQSLSKHRLAKLRLNAEIDQFLDNLTDEGMVSEAYRNFHAKACHVLGLQRCNRIAVNARNGINSERLYAAKIKGALQLHYKEQLDLSIEA